MANSLQSSSVWATTSQKTSGPMIGIWVSCLIRARSALNTLQTARMMSTLSSLSDTHLSQIGISRSDIPEYAAKLMENE